MAQRSPVHTLYGGHTCPREEALLERCLCCKGKEHKAFDEVIADPEPYTEPDRDRFSMVSKLEAMAPQERFAFWQGELSKCIRCNACRNVCPACSCLNCVFDNPASGVSGKANVDPFEEQLFHIIRAFHVGGPLHGLRRVQPRLPAGHPAAFAQPQIHPGYQSLLWRIPGGRGSGCARPADQLHDRRRGAVRRFQGGAK